ncbi:carbonic anhydrase [Microvirga sp. P5_D2]
MSSAAPSSRPSSPGEVIVVLGHSKCGAVKGVIMTGNSESSPRCSSALSRRLRPTGAPRGEHSSMDLDFVRQVTTTDAKLAAQHLQQNSQILRDLVARKCSRSLRRCMTSPAGASRSWNKSRRQKKVGSWHEVDLPLVSALDYKPNIRA